MKALMDRWIGDTVSGQLPEKMGQYALLSKDRGSFPIPGWIPPYHDDDTDNPDFNPVTMM